MNEVRRVLWMWRKNHNARRGQVWDPRQGKYVWPHQVINPFPAPAAAAGAPPTAFGRAVRADERMWE